MSRRMIHPIPHTPRDGQPGRTAVLDLPRGNFPAPTITIRATADISSATPPATAVRAPVHPEAAMELIRPALHGDSMPTTSRSPTLAGNSPMGRLNRGRHLPFHTT